MRYTRELHRQEGGKVRARGVYVYKGQVARNEWVNWLALLLSLFFFIYFHSSSMNGVTFFLFCKKKSRIACWWGVCGWYKLKRFFFSVFINSSFYLFIHLDLEVILHCFEYHIQWKTKVDKKLFSKLYYFSEFGFFVWKILRSIIPDEDNFFYEAFFPPPLLFSLSFSTMQNDGIKLMIVYIPSSLEWTAMLRMKNLGRPK